MDISNYNLTDKEFFKVKRALHLHLCRDTFINSNDFLVLLEEHKRNDNLEVLDAFISPYIRLTKVLRHWLIGLNISTQETIIERFDSVEGKIFDKTYNAELFALQPSEIHMEWANFIYIFFNPVFENYRHIFNNINFMKKQYVELLSISEGVDSIFNHFIRFSNFIYKHISSEFDLPLIVSVPLNLDKSKANCFINKSEFIEQFEKKLISQNRKLEIMRNEYKALTKCHSNLDYVKRKKLVNKLISDPCRTVNRYSYISDLEVIHLLDAQLNFFIDLFDLDKVFTKNYKCGTNINTKENIITIDTNELLTEIFNNYTSNERTIILQEFSREFDYTKYKHLARANNTKTYPSAVTTWKNDELLRDKDVKLMSFVFGLSYLFDSYVK